MSVSLEMTLTVDTPRLPEDFLGKAANLHPRVPSIIAFRHLA